MTDQMCVFDDDREYDAFVEKFKPKKTTDDCYTPPLVYDTIRDWACKKYKIDPACIVRPFYPGGDYEKYEYPVSDRQAQKHADVRRAAAERAETERAETHQWVLSPREAEIVKGLGVT